MHGYGVSNTSPLSAPPFHFLTPQQTGIMCIGGAVANTNGGTLSPAQWEFRDAGGPLVHNISGHMGSIDPSHHYDKTSDTHWLLYKSNGNTMAQPTVIYAAPLSADGMNVTGTAVPLLENDPRTWEGGCIEAPWMIEHTMPNGSTVHYLFYSGPGYCDQCHYAVGVAVSTTGLLGPWRKRGEPILSQTAADKMFASPGHCSVVPATNGGTAIVYHAYQVGKVGTGRHLMLDELVWDAGSLWPRLRTGGTDPSSTPQPLP